MKGRRLATAIALLAVVGIGTAWMVSGCASSGAGSLPPPSAQSANPPAASAEPGHVFSTEPTTDVPGAIGSGSTGFMRPPSSVAAPAPGVRADEVWVIERDRKAADHQQPQDLARSGALILPDHGPDHNVPIPLEHNDVSARIQGFIASVTVNQRYANPFDDKIEAVYVFPLPQDAAVRDFVMTIGDRHIRGVIREREEARKIYNEARAQGYVASLMTQERPNVFTQRVANIEPHKKIDVELTYFNALQYADGAYEFVFPMVVGPRFNPPGSCTGIGAISRDSAPSGQPLDVRYLAPDERTGHDIALKVDLDAGVPLESLQSLNHATKIVRQGPSQATVALDESDSIPNKDFVLRYKVAGDHIKNAMFVEKRADGRGGWFALMLFPPDSLRGLPRQPMEMVFTVDVSGSQSGAPLAQEKAATRYCLTHMNANDRFQVVRFGNTAQRLFQASAPADPDHVRHALDWVDGFNATEGTMLVDGVRASLLCPPDAERLRFVAFMTDGFIGNEAEALREIHNDLGDARLFSFGVGSSTNRYLLDHMAIMGNGVAAYLGLNDDAEKVMAAYFERISHPAMTNLAIDWGGASVEQVSPERIGDLFVGRPVIVTGRFSGEPPRQIMLKGTVGHEHQTLPVTVVQSAVAGPEGSIAAIWARTRLADLADRAVWQQSADSLPERRELALEYGLLSDFTSFIAVDSLTQTGASEARTVAVPVPVPAGVDYQTTVSDEGKEAQR